MYLRKIFHHKPRLIEKCRLKKLTEESDLRPGKTF